MREREKAEREREKRLRERRQFAPPACLCRAACVPVPRRLRACVIAQLCCAACVPVRRLRPCACRCRSPHLAERTAQRCVGACLTSNSHMPPCDQQQRTGQKRIIRAGYIRESDLKVNPHLCQRRTFDRKIRPPFPYLCMNVAEVGGTCASCIAHG